ncbi:MAG TPA: hypothetical protein VLD61_10675 [Methylomirabilota bacterium]|nr:hypothetical protein [Methylomirabilota bacterium]
MRGTIMAALTLAGVFVAPVASEEIRPGARLGQRAPEITGGPWINSDPLSVERLRGRVVYVEFWTFG